MTLTTDLDSLEINWRKASYFDPSDPLADKLRVDAALIAICRTVPTIYAEITALRAQVADVKAAMPIIKAIAKWEHKNGTVAAIMPDEYATFCKTIANASIFGSARAIDKEWFKANCWGSEL